MPSKRVTKVSIHGRPRMQISHKLDRRINLFEFAYAIVFWVVKFHRKNTVELVNSSISSDKHLKIFIFYRSDDKHEEDQSRFAIKNYAGKASAEIQRPCDFEPHSKPEQSET